MELAAPAPRPLVRRVGAGYLARDGVPVFATAHRVVRGDDGDQLEPLQHPVELAAPAPRLLVRRVRAVRRVPVRAAALPLGLWRAGV